jgi:hypothetical protein
MFVCCVCCVLSGRGLCDELITRPEESYRLWRVVCDQETSWYEEAIARAGLHSQRKKFHHICFRELGIDKIFLERFLGGRRKKIAYLTLFKNFVKELFQSFGLYAPYSAQTKKW